MNAVINFMRSEIYKNFWIFIIIGSLAGGLLVALSFVIFSLFDQHSGDLPMILYTSLFGMGFGFVAAFLGFLIMYRVGKNLSAPEFAKRSLVVGLILAMVVCLTSFGLWGFNLSFWILVFPGIPFLGSIFLFRYFSVRYIQPLVSIRN